MMVYGNEPFLECSSKGDERFSAFYARIRAFNNKSIEEIYQGLKVFKDGSTGHNWKIAKGKKAINQQECALVYSILWDIYIFENPPLLEVINSYNGFGDVFGKPNSCCQAAEIWRIYNVSK